MDVILRRLFQFITSIYIFFIFMTIFDFCYSDNASQLAKTENILDVV